MRGLGPDVASVDVPQGVTVGFRLLQDPVVCTVVSLSLFYLLFIK